jgi:hypothetical protein
MVKRGAASYKHKFVIGWREWVALPDFGVTRMKCKIDTGARTSALHATAIRYFDGPDGAPMVRFKVHPDERRSRHTIEAEAPFVEKRLVKSSSGVAELRPVIRTHVELAGVCWPLEITLARRELMGFRMLLGRQAMARRFIVDPARSYLAGVLYSPLLAVAEEGAAEPPAPAPEAEAGSTVVRGRSKARPGGRT